jgi:hypothetical protein
VTTRRRGFEPRKGTERSPRAREGWACSRVPHPSLFGCGVYLQTGVIKESDFRKGELALRLSLYSADRTPCINQNKGTNTAGNSVMATENASPQR